MTIKYQNPAGPIINVPGMNVNSNTTVGQTAIQNGIAATRRKQQKAFKGGPVGEMHTMVPTETHQDPITGEVIVDSFHDTGQNGSGAMSGRDALLGPAFDLIVGSKGLGALAKTSKFLYNSGKVIQKSIPYNPQNFYRGVGKDAIVDAKKSGVIRSSSYGGNPYFGHGREYWNNGYVIEGRQGSVQWMRPSNPNGEISKKVIKPGEKGYVTGSGTTAPEAFPYSNGTAQVSNESFNYWKKYPIIGWRKHKFRKGGKL